MEGTLITLLVGAGGGVLCLILVGVAYLVWRAVVGDSRRDPRQARPAQSAVSRPASRRSGAKERQEPVRSSQELIIEVQRTRTILLGWLSVLEAFAIGDAWRASALRAELGGINTCDVTLVGDASVMAAYQQVVGVLRNQAGRGMPPDLASEVASIRVRLLTALAEQERRLNQGERPLIVEPLAHLDLWGPPRPITEVIIRPSTEPAEPAATGDELEAEALPPPIEPPEPAQPSAEPTTEPGRILVPPPSIPRADREAAPPDGDERVPEKRPSPATGARPRLRALPDPAGPNGGTARTSAVGRAPRPPARLSAAPAKPSPPAPLADPKPAVASASSRPTSAVAKPAGSGPRKPNAGTRAPVGPAATAAKPAARSNGGRPRP